MLRQTSLWGKVKYLDYDVMIGAAGCCVVLHVAPLFVLLPAVKVILKYNETWLPVCRDDAAHILLR